MGTNSSLLAALVLSQFMWGFNLIDESGGRKEWEADPEEDKGYLIRPPPYLSS